jgi:DNA-directed RNA polymerase specialized sigma24 family protein
MTVQIPQGYSEQEVIKLIQKTAKALAPKYSFGFHGVDDIEQEAFMMGIEALKTFKHDAGSKLQSYLYTYIGNRLKNFKRNNYFRQEFTCKTCGCKDPFCKTCLKRSWRMARKAEIIEPIDIHSIENDDSLVKEHDFNTLHEEEITQEIDSKLPLSLREDYLKMRDGIYVPKIRRVKIEETIKEILQKWINIETEDH